MTQWFHQAKKPSLFQQMLPLKILQNTRLTSKICHVLQIPSPTTNRYKKIPDDWPKNLEPYDPTAREESDGDTDEASDDESKKKRKIKAMINSFMDSFDDLQDTTI